MLLPIARVSAGIWDSAEAYCCYIDRRATVVEVSQATVLRLCSVSKVQTIEVNTPKGR
jgi:hypothetical protein